MKLIFRQSIVLIVILLALSASASAKYEPYVELLDSDWGGMAEPYALPNAMPFYGLYGRLGTYGDVDAFSFDFQDSVTAFSVQAIVPVCGTYFENFYPSIAVIGPGLDAPEAGALPFDLPDGMGAKLLVETKLEGDRRVSGANSGYVSHAYFARWWSVDIPEAGQYTIALWEPDGNTGAYTLVTGRDHPEMSNDPVRDKERIAAFNLIESGAWMGQDCQAAAAAASCTTRIVRLEMNEAYDAPERWQVGEGFVLSGEVRDSATCMPIADAKVVFWMANPDGEYDGVGAGTLFTNQQGMYRIESGRPGGYEGGGPHIHIQVSAPGYEALESVYALLEGENEGVMPLMLGAK